MENITTTPSAKFGAIIRRRRKEIGVSPERLAADAHIGYHTLLKVERGDSDPRLGLILNLATILQMDPAELISETMTEV